MIDLNLDPLVGDPRLDPLAAVAYVNPEISPATGSPPAGDRPSTIRDYVVVPPRPLRR